MYLLPLARVLARRCTVYVPDLPGHGRSEAPSASVDIGDLADALAGWLDVVGLEQPAFVGSSMGCQIVTELAVRRPERTGPLVLIGPTVDPRRRRKRHQIFSLLRDAAREPAMLVALTAAQGPAMSPARLLASARSALEDRIEDRLPAIPQPTVVVHAENDGFVSREWAEEAAALLPSGRLEVIPGEPHAIPYTQPDVVAEIVWALLADTERADLSLAVVTNAARPPAARNR
jgi:pimeloyl-ACP methyl ester carboxylesterase